MNLRHMQGLLLPPPCPQASSTFLPGCGGLGPPAPSTSTTIPPKLATLALAHATQVGAVGLRMGWG